MGGGKPEKSSVLSSKRTSKGTRNTTPILTRNRAAAVPGGNDGQESDKTSVSSTPARANSLGCCDTVELLERKFLRSLNEMIDEKFTEMREYLDARFDKFDEITNKLGDDINSLQSTCSQLQLEVGNLKNSLEQVQQQLRLTDAVITGIPITKEEKPLQIANAVAGAVGVSLPEQVVAFRAKRNKSNVGPIILKFPSAVDRRFFLQEYRRSGPVKLNQISPGFSSSVGVGVYESLTIHNQQILREALSMRRKKLLHSAVTRNGIVHVRIASDSKWLKITDTDMLSRICSFKVPLLLLLMMMSQPMLLPLMLEFDFRPM